MPFFPKAGCLTITRLDVEFALQTGSKTLFSSIAMESANGFSSDLCGSKELLPSSASSISGVIPSILSFANILNSRQSDGQSKLDPLNYMEMLVSLLYGLIEAVPLGEPCSTLGEIYDDVTHLGMMAFMTTLLPEFGREDSRYVLLSERLESAIQLLHDTFADEQDIWLALLLWTLFIGGISVLKRSDHHWLILDICRRLHIYDWPTVLCRLCAFPWIHTLHDAAGQCLWEDARRRSFALSREFLELGV